MNRGRGIEIFHNYSDIIKFIGSQAPYSYWVTQKYLEKPLLYKSRKFDIRVWAIFTGKNEVFFYQKGYLRTSSFDYSVEDDNNYTHLTNNCLQQHGDNYGIHEEGNTIGFEQFQDYLNEAHADK
jgi:tubulin--tyrosine ligase